MHVQYLCVFSELGLFKGQLQSLSVSLGSFSLLEKEIKIKLELVTL